MERYPYRWRSPASWKRATAVALVPPALVTLLAIPESHPPTEVVAVLYVLGVVLAAGAGGAPAGIAASILSFLALNFFFTSPLHTFAVGAPEDLVSLLAFLVVAVIVGLLLSAAVEARARAERRELEARLVNRLATRLLAGDATEDVLRGLAAGIADAFGFARCEIVTTFTSEPLTAGDAPSTEPLVVNATAHGRPIGQISVWSADGRSLGPDERSIVESLATQIALALEGMRLSSEVRRAELEARSSQMKAALFSGVTHDVKTPLAAIMTAVTSLIEGQDFSDEDRNEHLDTIKHEAERLHRVVNNLLELARVRAGALTPVKVASPIDELMESVINRLRPLLGARSIEIRVGEDVPEVPMDVVQIDQVLTNLVENAIKFTPAESPISLSAVGSDRVVRVTVADQGPGIPKEDRLRIFEPFERAEGSATGTGLGLAISNAIVVAHGGRMWVSDHPAGGAAFTFELPCYAEVPQEVIDARTGARG